MKKKKKKSNTLNVNLKYSFQARVICLPISYVQRAMPGFDGALSP